MNVTELMAQIRTEMTGNPEKDIRHLQDIATDLRKEENASELLSAIAEFAFNMMPEGARKEMIETTFVGDKRLGSVQLIFSSGVHLFPFLCSQFLELWQLMSWVQSRHHVANFSHLVF